MALKVFSVFSYLFMNLFLDSDVNTFIFTIMFLSGDFWFVKNISGRILVGL